MATQLSYPTAEEIHAQLLSDLRYGYARLGVTVNVAKDSELWHRTKAVANRLSVAIANGKIGLRKINPLTATGADLEEWASIFGITRRPPIGASGFVKVSVLSPASSLLIPSDFACTSAAGIRYQTVSATTVATGDVVQVQAVDTGARTDLAAGQVLVWDSASIGYLDQKATVDAGGLDGGGDEDDDETLRARLLRRLSFPAVGGNWSQIVDWAIGASAAVKGAWVYMTESGPSSTGVAITGDPLDPVLNSTVTNAVAAAIRAEMPGNIALNVTSVSEQQLDVVVNLGLPLPVSAGGQGGGWIDAEPWPSTNETGSNVFGKITAWEKVTITVDSTSDDPPVAGNHIAIWDYAHTDADGNPDPVFREFTIGSVGGSSGAYTVTLDTDQSSLAFVEVGMYVSPAAVHLQTYADIFRDAMGQLGPGEKTTNADILAYCRRKPGTDIDRPSSLTSRQLSEIEKQRTEVSDVSFAARFETGTTTTRTGPGVPVTTASAPKLLTLKHLSFRYSA